MIQQEAEKIEITSVIDLLP